MKGNMSKEKEVKTMEADQKKRPKNQEMQRRMLWYKEKLQKVLGKEKKYDDHE